MNTHEQLGLIIDRCDNYLAARILPLPDCLHVEGLAAGIASIKFDLEVLKSHLDKHFVPVEEAKEREARLINASKLLCDTTLSLREPRFPTTAEIYANAGIDELINKSVVKESLTTETNASKED